MKHASILLLMVALCGFSFAACAEGDDTAFGNKPGSGEGGEGGEGGNGTGNGGGGGKTSSSSSSSSSSSASSSSGNSSGGACMVNCSADSDCQSQCSVPPVGINCCDVGTNTCYVSGADVCPSQGASSGSMY